MPILSGLYNQLFGNRQHGQQPTASSDQSQYGQVNDLERFLLDTKQEGQDIAAGMNRTLGLNTDQQGNFDILGTWGDVIDFDEDDDGTIDLGRIVTTPLRGFGAAAQTVGALPGMMVQGWSEAPTYLYSALTGSPIAAEDAVDENGNIMRGDLDAAERLGAGVYGGLNVVPVGFGSAIGKGGAQIAKAAGMNVTKDQLEKGLFGAAADQAAASAKGIGGVMKSAGIRAGEQMLEEGIEEAVQEVGQNALNDRDLMTNVGESFLGGALAGGTMGALRGGLSATRNAVTGGANGNNNGNNNGNAPRAVDQLGRPVTSNSIGRHGIAAVEDEVEKSRQRFQTEPGTTAGMGTSRNHLYGANSADIGMSQIENILESEAIVSQRTANSGNPIQSKAGSFFTGFDFDGSGRTMLEQWNDAKMDTATISQFVSAVNRFIAAKEANGQVLDLYVMKNPGGTRGIVKVKLGHVSGDSRVGLSQTVAFLCNADFDSDQYVITVDNRDMYRGVRYASMQLSASDTYRNMSDMEEALGIRDENRKNTVNRLAALYNAMGVNSGDITADEFKTLVSRVVGREVGVNGDKVDQLINDGGLNSMSSIIGWLIDNSSMTEERNSSIIDDMLVAIGAENANTIVAAANTAAAVANEIFDDNRDGKERLDKSQADNAYQPDLGRINSMVEAKMALFRTRLFIDVAQGEAACRENLSMYFAIKDTVRFYFETNPNGSLTDSELFTLLTKNALGIEAYGVHPEDLASGAVKLVARSNALKEYEKLAKKTIISSKEDKETMTACLKEAYETARSKYMEALKREDQSGREISVGNGWALPEWRDSDSDAIFYLVFGDMTTESLYGVKPMEGVPSESITSLVSKFGMNDDVFVELFGIDENDRIRFLRNDVRRFLSVEKAKNGRAGKAVKDSIVAMLDGGIGEALRILRNANFDYNDPSVSPADRFAIMRWVDALSYYAGKGDFSKAGFHTFEEMMSTVNNRDVMMKLMSDDAAVVMDALETLTLRNKMRGLYDACLAFANNTNEAENTRLVNNILKELEKLQRISPFYSAFVSYFKTRMLFNRHRSTNKDDLSVTETVCSNEWAKRWFDRSNGFFSVIMDTSATERTTTRKTMFDRILWSCPRLSIIDDDATMFVSIMESEKDSLDMQTPASRARKAKPYADFAASENLSALKREKEMVFETIRRTNGFNSQNGARSLIEALRYRSVRNMNEFGIDSMAYLMDTASEYLEAARDKTKALSAALSIWERRSISQMGFSPTEIRNMSLGTVTSDMLEDNPQLSSILFLTDYIKDQGGIYLVLEDGKTFFIEDRWSLIGSMIGETGLSEESISIAHLEKLCEVCPNMIHLITPISSSFSDANGYRVTFGIDYQDHIERIVEDLAKTPSIESQEGGMLSFLEKERIAIRQNKILLKMMSNAKTMTFALSTFDWGEYNKKTSRKARRDYVSKHMSNVAAWTDEYISSTEDHRKKMETDLFGGSMNRAAMSLVRTIDEAERMFDSYANMSQSSYVVDIERIFSLAENDLARDSLSKELSDILGSISHVLNAANIDISSVINNDALANFEASVASSGIPEATASLRKILHLQYLSSEVSGATENVLMWAGHDNMTEVYNEAISNLKNIQDSILQTHPTQGLTQDQIDDAAGKIEGKIRSLKSNIDNADYLYNRYFVSDDNEINPVLRLLDDVLITDPSNIRSLYQSVKQIADEYVFTGTNDIKKNVLDPMEKFVKWADGWTESDGAFDDVVLRPDSNEALQWKITIVSRLLSNLAQTSISRSETNGGVNLKFIGEGSSLMDSVRGIAMDSEFLEDLQKYSKPGKYMPATPPLSFHLDDPMSLARIGNALANAMSGNVEKGVQMNAIHRSDEVAYGLQPSEPDFKATTGRQARSMTRDDLVAEFYGIRGTERQIENERSLFYGRYKEAGTNQWKALRPYTIVSWRNMANGGNTQIEVELLRDDSCGFDNGRSTPSSNGAPYSQWLDILARLTINTAEALNLKTKKNLKAFMTSSFANQDLESQGQVRDASISTYDNPLTDVATAISDIEGMIKSTKKAYRSALETILNRDEAHRQIDLSYSDIKVISDHVIQGAIIEFEDGYRDSVMLRDMFSIDASGNPVAGVELAQLINDHGGIKTARVHIFDISVLGRTLARKTVDRFISNYMPRNPQRGLALDQDSLWRECYAEVLRTWKIDVAQSGEIAPSLSDTLSRVHVNRFFGPDSFVNPENSAIKFNDGSTDTFRSLSHYSKEMDSAIEKSGVIERYGNDIRIARYFTDYRLTENQASMFSYTSNISENGNLQGWSVILERCTNPEKIQKAFEFAFKTGCEILVLDSEVNNAIMNEARKYGFIDKGYKTLKNSQAHSFSASANLGRYSENLPKSGLTYVDPNSIVLTVMSDYSDIGDGHVKRTSAGMDQIEKSNAVVHREHVFDFAKVRPGETKTVRILRGAELRNANVTAAGIRYAVDALGIKGFDMSMYETKVRNAVSAFMANPSSIGNDGLSNGAISQYEVACVGIANVVIGSQEYNIPIIANKVPVGSTVSVSIDSANTSMVNIVAATPILGSRGDIGVQKGFDPYSGLKYTVDDSLAVDHSVVCGDGSTWGIHQVASKKYNAGKVDYDEQKKTNYMFWMHVIGESLWFKTAEDGTRILSPIFNRNSWSDEQIKVGSGKEKKEIAGKIASGELRFATSMISFGDRFGDSLMQIARNCYKYNIDMFSALSGVLVSNDVANTLIGNGSKSLGRDRFSVNTTYPTNALLWQDVSSDDIQTIFHFVNDKHWAPLKQDGTGNETFNKYGEMMVRPQNGKRQYMRVTIGTMNYDETMSTLQQASTSSRIGNKQKQMTRFSTMSGDYESCMVEMLRGLGMLGSAESWMKRRSVDLGLKTETDTREIEQANSDKFVNMLIETISPERAIRERRRNQTNEEMRLAFESPIPISDSNNNRISTGEMEGSETEFVNSDLRLLKTQLEGSVFGGNKITCREFLTIVKLGLGYAANTDGSPIGISFYLSDIRKMIESIPETINRNHIPFNGGTTVRTGNNFVRFGMPILPPNIANLFITKCPSVKSHYRNNGGINRMYTDMLSGFETLMNNSALENKIQRKSLFALGEYLSRGTIIDGNPQFDRFVAGLTLKELVEEINNIDESILGEEFRHFDDIRKVSRKNVDRTIANIERQLRRHAKSSKGSYDGSGVFAGNFGEPRAIELANNLVALRQIMSVCDPMLMPASIVERQVYGNPTKWLMHNGINGRFSPFKSNIRKLIGDRNAMNLVETIKDVSKNNAELRDTFGSIRAISFLGNFDFMLSEAVKSGNISRYLKSIYSNKNGLSGKLRKAADIAFEWSSGKNIGATMQIDTFISSCARLMSLDPKYRWYFDLNEAGISHFQERLEADPNAFIAELFSQELRPIAMQAFNTAMQGDAAQKTVLSVIFNEYCAQSPAMNFFVKTFMSPFVQYGINVSGRHLNAILPVSTFNYVLTKLLSVSHIPVPGLRTYTEGGDVNRVYFDQLNLEDTQTCASLREALMLDLLHMGTFATAALIVGLGCLEPPDDDDKWCNVNEWTFLGRRIELNWWLKDTIGPVLGIACAWKSAALGKPNIAVMMNNVAECMYANPLIRSTDFVEMLVNPYESYMESYYEDLDRFIGSKDGEPSPTEVLFANVSIAGMNWATSFVLPTILKDLYRNSTEYEVSYKRIYEENATGQLTEDGMNGATRYATYFDQKLRQATRKNPVLGWLCDIALNPNTGYLANEMPRTVYYDPAQMNSMQALSLYTTDEYGNKIQKPDRECQAIALGVIMMLQSYDDMGELMKTGFALPYDTMDYVGDVVWDIANGSTEMYNQYIDNGDLDYYKLGGGDYELGQQMAQVLGKLYEQNYSYWSDFYYNKLWSDEMKSGLVKYNRYNTTYQQDSNGEWYATGYRNTVGNIVSPFIVAPGEHSDMLGIDRHGSTMGYNEDWDTQSVVTGLSTGERALIPNQDNIETPKFSSRGSNGDGTGYSRSYTRYSSSYGGSSYTSPVRPSTTRVGNSGGGYSSFNLPRTPGIDTTTYRSPNLSYLRPSFETKGSRKAYKREEL